jgi:hypothetical protein
MIKNLLILGKMQGDESSTGFRLYHQPQRLGDHPPRALLDEEDRAGLEVTLIPRK